MYFIDTHCHLYQPDFENDIDEVLQRALSNNVTKCLLPNIDVASIKPMLRLTQKYPQHCFPMMGLHPTSVKDNYREELRKIERELKSTSHPYVAVGEIGIDLYWDKTYFKEQQEAFRIQIGLSKTCNKPIVIHARESFNEIFDIMDDMNDDSLRGVFHSFSGSGEQVEKILDYGFYFGIGGIVTFKNAGLDKVIPQIPLEKIIFETDSPYLAPSPHRGKRNESANIRYIAERVANLKDKPIEEVASVTSQNAEHLFNLNKYGQ